MSQGDAKVEELRDLEEERGEGESEDEDAEEIHKDLLEDMDQMKQGAQNPFSRDRMHGKLHSEV